MEKNWGETPSATLTKELSIHIDQVQTWHNASLSEVYLSEALSLKGVYIHVYDYDYISIVFFSLNGIFFLTKVLVEQQIC